MTLRGHAARTCRPLVVDGTRVEAVAVDDARRHVRALGRGLAEAQEAGDVGALDSLLSDDCTVVGPSGKVLDKKRWLELFRSGALVMRSVEWVDVRVTSHGTVAVAVGRQTHVAEYRRRSADGRFRVTLVAVRSGDRWRVVALHASAITARSGRGQGGRPTTRTRRTARKRHTVESDDRLIEDIRAGRVSPDDPDPVAALLARWRLGGRPSS